MFGNKKPDAPANPAAKQKSSSKASRNVDTLVGQNTRITGDIEFSGGLHIDGTVVGNTIANQSDKCILRVSDRGVIEGNVSVPHVVLNGTVKGDVVAHERIELGASARVIGNVYYALIEMAIGAEINGQLIHQSPEKKKPTVVRHDNKDDGKLSAVK